MTYLLALKKRLKEFEKTNGIKLDEEIYLILAKKSRVFTSKGQKRLFDEIEEDIDEFEVEFEFPSFITLPLERVKVTKEYFSKKEKKDIIKEVSDNLSVPNNTVKRVINETVNVVVSHLKNGEKIGFHGFGSFEVVRIPSRYVRSINDKRIIKIPLTKKVRFKNGDSLKRKINEEEK